jgi:RNA polymerase sigma-70 factor (ECF subfamily)
MKDRINTVDSDTILMLDFKNGNEMAFDALFKKYTKSLLNFVYKFIQDKNMAEEITQDIFIKIYMARNSYEPEAKFTTWMYKIATNTCLNELRKYEYKTKIYSINEEKELEDGRVLKQFEDVNAKTQQKNLEDEDFEKAIYELLKNLPQRQRACFTLKRFQDLSYKEIGKVLGCSERAVKSLLSRSKTALLNIMKKTRGSNVLQKS